MNALIWLLVAVLGAFGLALTVDLIDVLPGSAQTLVGSGVILVAFWLGLYVLRHRTDYVQGANSFRLHDAFALGFYLAMAFGFFVVMARAGWSPRLGDRAVRDSVTFLLLSGVAWHIVSSYWLGTERKSDKGENVGPPTVRTAMMIQVLGVAVYLGFNADRLPPLPPMLVANGIIQMLLFAVVIGAFRTLITPRPGNASPARSTDRDPILPR